MSIRIKIAIYIVIGIILIGGVNFRLNTFTLIGNLVLAIIFFYMAYKAYKNRDKINI